MFVACIQVFFHIQRKATNSVPRNNKVIKNSQNSSWRHVIYPYMCTISLMFVIVTLHNFVCKVLMI